MPNCFSLMLFAMLIAFAATQSQSGQTPGQRAFLSTGVGVNVRPRPDSDGKYGRLQAINLETKKTVWTERQRAPQRTGVLATAGGVVFAGALDRWFTAYDDTTGTTLWMTRLNGHLNCDPATDVVNGVEYVADVAADEVPPAANL